MRFTPGLSCLLVLCAHLAAGAVQTFPLREWLGQSWSNEVVWFPLDNQVTGDGSGYQVTQKDGKAVPFQFVTETNGPRSIALAVDLPAFAEQVYTLEKGTGKNTAPTDLGVDEEKALIRITNSLTGLEIPTAAGVYSNGPFLRMKLRSGSWIGGSRLSCQTPIATYEASVIASGPVYAEVRCRYTFEGGKTWQVNYRIMAHEPVVRVEETCQVPEGSSWQILLNPGFNPTHSFASVSYGNKEEATYKMSKLPGTGAAVFSLAPWPLWWNPSSVGFVGLFRVPEGALVAGGAVRSIKPDASLDPAADAGSDLVEELKQEERQSRQIVEPAEDFLGVAVGQGERWANPGDDGQGKNMPLVAGVKGDLYLSCSLSGPGRLWFLAALTTRENLVDSKSLSRVQSLMVKHLETPLNEVKDMVLQWESKTAYEYPRLVLRRTELAARPEVKDSVAQRQAMRKTDAPGPRARKLLDPALRIFLGSVDQPAQSMDTVHRCERILNIATTADMILGSDVLTRPERNAVLGIHAVQWGRPVLNDGDVFSEADIQAARAQIAFLAYKLASPNYYSLERNYRANPNMTTVRYCTMTILAALIPDHPKAKEWAQGGLDEVERELKEWTAPNGGWIESPHYQTGSMAGMMLLSLSARNAGFADFMNDARLQGALRYLARISTPPDPRFDNKRHFPPAGNTYMRETTGLLGIMAKACRPANPELADELQWAWIQQGRPRNGLLVDFYNQALFADWEPDPPKWGSEHFPGSGVVLRTGFPGPRETYLYLLQGWFDQHYDYDRGSFEFWGKGRPLCLDWGYDFKTGRMPPWLHNRVDAGNIGEIRMFQKSEQADYVSSLQGGWERQLVLVKDRDPRGPTYVVLRDSIAQPVAAWWLWLYTEHSPQLLNGVLQVTGRDDVDLDIWFPEGTVRHLKQGKPKLPQNRTKTEKPAAASLTDVLKGDPEEDEGLKDVLAEKAAPQSETPGMWIETRTETIDCFDMCSMRQESLTQEGLSLPVTKDEPVFGVLFPRLKGEKPAAFAPLAEGRGVKVTHGAGTDYVFLSGTPFEFRDGPVFFRGRAGLIRVRGQVADLTLCDGSEISFGDKTLTSPAPASR